MEFRLLGPLEAWHDNINISETLGDQQQRFILVVLLLHANKPVSAERLTDVVWADNPDRRSLVRGYINKLRKAFRDAGAADVSIDTTPTGYVLRIAPDQIDTVRFDRLREESLLASDPRRQIELLRAAVDLWRGYFLEDIDLDRVGGADVISSDVGYLDAVGDLAELELRVGDNRTARDRLRRVVQADPTRQKHAELLMRALLASGDQVDAIRVFHATRSALAELGLKPSLTLRKIAARAERGEPVSSLPPRPRGFTGRTEELDAIDVAAATVGERRAVWVSGAPHVGKTTLAIEAAYRLRERFPDGQLLIRINATSLNLVDLLLHELGVPPEQIPGIVSQKIMMYQRELYSTRTLIVLDNAVSPDDVRALVAEGPGCFTIVTSRVAGALDIGRELRLDPPLARPINHYYNPDKSSRGTIHDSPFNLGSISTVISSGEYENFLTISRALDIVTDYDNKAILDDAAEFEDTYGSIDEPLTEAALGAGINAATADINWALNVLGPPPAPTDGHQVPSTPLEPLGRVK